MMKMLEKYWLVLVKHFLKPPALVSYCIEPIQTNHKKQYLKDNKPVLKIALFLTLIKLNLFYKSKIEGKNS